jgi:hypothetical protein
MRVLPRRPRFGCLGCLTQCILVLVVAGGAVTAAQWIFYPWAFQFGGRTHLLPYWYGAAQVRAASGDYLVYVWFGPARPNRYAIGPRLPSVSGNGYICTPHGERIPLRVYGNVGEASGADTNGKPMRLELYRRPWYWSLAGNWDRRPRLELRGRWENPDLVMNDGGGFAAAFLADGRVYDGPARNQPKAGAPVPVVFHEVPWTVVTPACR